MFLTDNFPPEVNAPASRTYEHCREWVNAGHRVTVITCAPNFPQGKVFPGYRNKLWQTESMNGVKVIRVWSYITANEGFAKRILDYISYMFTATIASLFVKRADLIIGTSPQFFTACAAYSASRLKKIPYIFELRDLWPESIKAVGAIQSSSIIRFLEQIEMFLYRKAAHVVSVTESFKRTLIERGIDGGKIDVVTNGVDLSRFRPMVKDDQLVEHYGLKGKFVVGYIGTHGMAHSLETILEAAEKVRGLENGDVFRFLFLGNGARKQALRERAERMGLDNVIFIESVPKEKVPCYWSLLDVSVIHLKKTPLFETVIPSKLFESMGMGIPVLHGVTGESAEIVEREGAGVVFEPEHSEQLIKMLVLLNQNENLYGQLKQNGLKGARNYDRTVLAKKMLNLLETIRKDQQEK